MSLHKCFIKDELHYSDVRQAQMTDCGEPLSAHSIRCLQSAVRFLYSEMRHCPKLTSNKVSCTFCTDSALHLATGGETSPPKINMLSYAPSK